ncbi:hypothetical protein L6258_00010 [Candidatus Parcubacteria bacterium]|nr:hypothetical protein [Candidatus Parcubacteria bacterium]
MDKVALIGKVLAQAPVRPGDWASSPEEPPKLQDLEFIFSRLLTGVFALAGLAAFSYLLIGGFKYLTSGGDEKAVTAAKATLTTAVVGLIIVVAGYILLNTLSTVLGGTSYFGSFLQFKIPE